MAFSCSSRGLRPQVDPLEHEVPQVVQRREHGRDSRISGVLARLDQVRHQRVDARAVGGAERGDAVRREVPA